MMVEDMVRLGVGKEGVNAVFQRILGGLGGFRIEGLPTEEDIEDLCTQDMEDV